ncbi:hypothetical protein CWE08_05960 [Aliidiomarina iranensis]|uniref:Toxin co-regulated pilus biosynthesis protein Q C-terminal domain-containing protein n=1 Tax=Aliidiomarina iranensis TaxID=1434071 RepID=A0A432VX47_9GAMM|nr:hypothetical protein [Aliidiomarina iranensis]RUO21135.1 hypothetical protein CWE08_05960 [Aliidiomarina iranensis]
MHLNLSKVSASSCFLLLFGNVDALAFSLPDCPPLNLQAFSKSANSVFENSQWAEIELKPGLLRPQLEQLLKEHWGIQNIVWYAEDGHYWPTRYAMRAATWDELLNTLIAPYHLKVTLHANHTAVVDYLFDKKGG